MRHRFGEFFSGPGGMSLGASLATASLAGRDLTLESRWAVDLDANACRTYHRNVHRGRGELVSAKGDEAPSIPGGRQARDDAPLVVNANVRSVDPRRLDDIEAFLFGFPCNDFSSVGERKGLNGSFGELYRDGLRVIREKKPLWFMAENVSGLLLANERTAFRQIVEHLTHPEEGLEYRLVPHLYRFEEYGIPQTRHRVIIVGVRKTSTMAAYASSRPRRPGASRPRARRSRASRRTPRTTGRRRSARSSAPVSPASRRARTCGT